MFTLRVVYCGQYSKLGEERIMSQMCAVCCKRKGTIKVHNDPVLDPAKHKVCSKCFYEFYVDRGTSASEREAERRAERDACEYLYRDCDY